MLAIRHAEENASNEPTNDAGIMAIPRGDGGYPSHLLAVFGDVSLQSISKAGASCGIPLPTIIEAYRVARLTVAGANPELNEALNGGWQGGSIAEQRLAVVI